ncbi:MAG: hypothetical protein RR101_13635 [Burkholderiaceae bacterium]
MSVQLVAPAPANHTPRVLNPELVERLATLTKAERELRAMGIEIEHSMLTIGRPEIGIRRRPGQSLAALLDRMGPRDYRQAIHQVEVRGAFMDCTVSWMESRA